MVSGELAFPEKTSFRDGRTLSRYCYVVCLSAVFK